MLFYDVLRHLPGSALTERLARPPQSRNFSPLGGARLHMAVWEGSGEPLLLLHGLGGHAHWWDAAAPRLASGFRPAALDFRGHGDSAWAEPPSYSVEDHADDVEAARSELGWERFTLAGHSFGARVALEYARRHPGRLERLALLDFMPQIPEQDPARFRLARRARQPSYLSLEELAARFHLQPDGTSAEADLLAAVARFSGRPREDGRWTWKFDWRGFQTRYDPVWDILPGLDFPCLVLRGEHSTVMSRDDLKRVVTALPRGTGAEIAGAHHHVTLDAPEPTARLLLDFARSA